MQKYNFYILFLILLLPIFTFAIDGACSNTRATTFPSSVSDWPIGSVYCLSGTQSVSPPFPNQGDYVTWICESDDKGVSSQICTARRELPSPINGACGEANGKSFSTSPIVGLCSQGNASAVFGSGPWNWSCNGIGEGSTNSLCSTLSNSSIVNGICSNTLNYCQFGVLTDAGVQDDNSTHYKWKCSGEGEGATDANCTLIKSSDFLCTGEFDKNSIIFEGDNVGLTENTQITLTDTNSSKKCEYRCIKNFVMNDTNTKCIPNPFVCIGESIENAAMFFEDNTDLDENTLVSLVESNTSNKCEYYCTMGYDKGTGADENKCIKPAYSCNGAIDPNSEIYEGDNNNLTFFDNRANVLSFTNTSLKCEWHCKEGYFLADSNEGYECVEDNREEFSCTGVIDSNAVVISGDSIGLDYDLNRVLVDVNTSRKCEYVCRKGYYLGLVDGVKVCLPSVYSCKGSVVGGVIYLGDDFGLSGDLNVVLVSSNTSRKCEYHCMKNYSKVGDSCVANSVSTAICGNAKRGFTPGEIFPGNYSLCDRGTPSISNPTLSETIGSITEWSCNHDLSVNCSATRLSTVTNPPTGDNGGEDLKNSILKIISTVNEEGKIEVTLKCLKTTTVDLSVSDYVSKENYSIDKTRVDCLETESTHTVNLNQIPDSERSLVINASISNKIDCSTCELEYFFEYSSEKKEESESNNLLIFGIIFVIIILIIGIAAFLILKKPVEDYNNQNY